MALKFAIKSGLAYSAMHYSCNLGVWGSSVQTEKLYNDLKGMANPHVQTLKKKMPFEIPPLPEKGKIKYLAIHYYNKGVDKTFHFIIMLPCYAGQLMKKATDAINKQLEAPPVKNN